MAECVVLIDDSGWLGLLQSMVDEDDSPLGECESQWLISLRFEGSIYSKPFLGMQIKSHENALP